MDIPAISTRLDKNPVKMYGYFQLKDPKMNIRTAAMSTPLALAVLATVPACSTGLTPEERASHLLKTTAPLRATSAKIIEGCKSVLAAADVELFDRVGSSRDLESPFNFDYSSDSVGTCSRYLRKGGVNDDKRNTWVTYSSPEGKGWSMVLSPIDSIQAFPPGGKIEHVGCDSFLPGLTHVAKSMFFYKDEGALHTDVMYLDEDEPCSSIVKDTEDGLRDLRSQVYDLKN